jgi:hypothetical protein
MGGAEIDPTESLMPLLNYSRSGLLIRLHALVVYNLDESICTYVRATATWGQASGVV